jgi:hypothetical protein
LWVFLLEVGLGPQSSYLCLSVTGTTHVYHLTWLNG